MHTIASVATALVAGLHVYILVLEMFLWDTPKGRKVFGLTPEFAAAFLGCVIVAGVYGAATANKRILFVQAAPAAVALALVLASRYAG